MTLRVLLKSRLESIIKEAEQEAEVIKKNKLLEVKEKFLHLKADLEKQVAQRNAKIQSIESKLKQRELNMNQRQEELQRKNSEVEATRENLTAQLDLIEKKKQDLDKLHQKEVEHLETLSGLSAEEAKERLIESLKDEAKTEAASYINEIIEEARKDCLSLNVTVLGERPCMGEIPADRQAALLNRAKEAIATQWDKEVATYPGSTDCNIPFSLDIPSICFGGYIGKGAHTREEHIYLDSIPAGTAIIAAFLLDYFK